MKLSKSKLNLMANALLSIYLDDIASSQMSMNFTYCSWQALGSERLSQKHIDDYNNLIRAFPEKVRKKIYNRAQKTTAAWLQGKRNDDDISAKNLVIMIGQYQDLNHQQTIEAIQNAFSADINPPPNTPDIPPPAQSIEDARILTVDRDSISPL